MWVQSRSAGMPIRYHQSYRVSASGNPVAGGSGFLGRPFAARLALARHEVVILTRHDVIGRPVEGLRYVTWKPDGTIPIAGRVMVPTGGRSRFDDWTNEVADAAINLAGENLAGERWSAQRKTVHHDEGTHGSGVRRRRVLEVPTLG